MKKNGTRAAGGSGVEKRREKKKLNAFNKWLTSNRPGFSDAPYSQSNERGEIIHRGRDKAE